MRVAVAVDNNMVTQHFGHCEYFIVYDIEDNQKTGSEILKNPPHQRGYLPKYLKEHDIDVVITGSLGEMAQKLMKSLGMKVFCGAQGSAVDIINKYLAGELEDSGDICNQHQHHHGQH